MREIRVYLKYIYCAICLEVSLNTKPVRIAKLANSLILDGPRSVYSARCEITAYANSILSLLMSQAAETANFPRLPNAKNTIRIHRRHVTLKT